MATIGQISDYIILRLNTDGNSDLTSLKLQKLLYYVQAWHLAFFGIPMFEGEFQAWVHGPVNREIYNLYKATKYTYSPITLEDMTDKEVASKLTENELLHVNNILDAYAGYTPTQLEFMTHNEAPWQESRKGLTQYARGEKVINEGHMAEFYAARLKA